MVFSLKPVLPFRASQLLKFNNGKVEVCISACLMGKQAVVLGLDQVEHVIWKDILSFMGLFIKSIDLPMALILPNPIRNTK
jgi:hypothetical protein